MRNPDERVTKVTIITIYIEMTDWHAQGNKTEDWEFSWISIKVTK